MCESCSPVPGVYCGVCGGVTPPADLFGAAGMTDVQLSLVAVEAPDGDGAGRVSGIIYGHLRPAHVQRCGGGRRVLRKKLAGH